MSDSGKQFDAHKMTWQLPTKCKNECPKCELIGGIATDSCIVFPCGTRIGDGSLEQSNTCKEKCLDKAIGPHEVCDCKNDDMAEATCAHGISANKCRACDSMARNLGWTDLMAAHSDKCPKCGTSGGMATEGYVIYPCGTRVGAVSVAQSNLCKEKCKEAESMKTNGWQSNDHAAANIIAECNAIRDMLLAKNAKYGNSALEPMRVMSKADPVEQLRVRIDDKLSRLSQGNGDDEDTLLDLCGYLILLRVAMKHQPKEKA